MLLGSNTGYATEAKFKRRTFCVPYRMSKIPCSSSFALGLVHEKFDVSTRAISKLQHCVRGDENIASKVGQEAKKASSVIGTKLLKLQKWSRK